MACGYREPPLFSASGKPSTLHAASLPLVTSFVRPSLRSYRRRRQGVPVADVPDLEVQLSRQQLPIHHQRYLGAPNRIAARHSLAGLRVRQEEEAHPQ